MFTFVIVEKTLTNWYSSKYLLVQIVKANSLKNPYPGIRVRTLIDNNLLYDAVFFYELLQPATYDGDGVETTYILIDTETIGLPKMIEPNKTITLEISPETSGNEQIIMGEYPKLMNVFRNIFG
jgi:hypothetical protein